MSTLFALLSGLTEITPHYSLFPQQCTLKNSNIQQSKTHPIAFTSSIHDEKPFSFTFMIMQANELD